MEAWYLLQGWAVKPAAGLSMEQSTKLPGKLEYVDGYACSGRADDAHASTGYFSDQRLPDTPPAITLAVVVKIFVAITDRSWFDCLVAAVPDEVNFWQPSGSTNFRALAQGELFLFKLHAPIDVIGGVFSHASIVPLSIAWEGLRHLERRGQP